MLYAIKNSDGSEKFKEFVSLQVKDLGLQDKLFKQIFSENSNIVFELRTATNKDTSED